MAFERRFAAFLAARNWPICAASAVFLAPERASAQFRPRGSCRRIAGACHLIVGSWQHHFGTMTLSTYSPPNGRITRAEHTWGRRRGRGPAWIATWAHGNTGWRASCAASPGGGWARSGEADVQDEVPEPQVEYSAAGPVHDGCQQDDSQDYDDHPEEKHNDAGDGIPGYSPRSSHGHQLLSL